jgi:hypothetical protein
MWTDDIDRLRLAFAFVIKFIDLIRAPTALIVASFYPHTVPLFAPIIPAFISPHFGY